MRFAALVACILVGVFLVVLMATGHWNMLFVAFILGEKLRQKLCAA